MSEKNTNAAGTVHKQQASSAPARQRGLVVTCAGRGHRGKTMVLRFLVERAMAAGRTVHVADGDRYNRTAARYFSQCMSPRDARETTMAAWLTGVVGYASEQQATVVLDVGGGDRALLGIAPQLAARIAPQPVPSAGGWGASIAAELTRPLDLTVLYMLGGEFDDARGLALLNGTLLSTARLMLVCNEGIAAPRRDGVDPFDGLMRDPAVEEAIGRGAAVLRMAALDPAIAQFLDEGAMRFEDALSGTPNAGGRALSLWDRQTLLAWLREFEYAVSPHGAMLP
jgi:hypothetical protein